MVNPSIKQTNKTKKKQKKTDICTDSSILRFSPVLDDFLVASQTWFFLKAQRQESKTWCFDLYCSYYDRAWLFSAL